MLRMLLASEMLDYLVGPPAPEGTPRAQLQMQANVDINMREDVAWFDNLLSAIADNNQQEPSAVASKAQAIMALAEAIRYVQLGNPESILIDNGEPKDRDREDKEGTMEGTFPRA
jgi:hypothetical protein